MKPRNPKPRLSAYVHLVLDLTGAGKNKRAIRRPLLVDRNSGLLHELPTAYVYRTLGRRALNTQISVLYDLAFYLEWVALRANRLQTRAWARPEERVRSGKLALSQREVNDLANWCQTKAGDLGEARHRETTGVRVLHTRRASVEGATTNRRLHNICNYLCWLTIDMVEGALMVDDRQIAKSSKFQASLRRAFQDAISGVKLPPPISALSRPDSIAFRRSVAPISAPTSSEHGTRDRLIGRMLLNTGLRSGELLKLKCEDLEDNFEITPGKFISILKIIRRPNDVEDDRLFEPSIKTLPGPIVISRQLASQLIQYISNERRAAIDRCMDSKETPYLFVSHFGPQVGRPITYRNLNRIVSKLRAASAVTAKLSPHTLRHTHFTELRDLMAAKGAAPKEAQRILQERGHWSPNSSMPDNYSQRYLVERQAHFVEERDRILEYEQHE